jgi:hypothetical protein
VCEKANKSLLALIKTEYLGEQETIIEEYFTKKIGHDKAGGAFSVGLLTL